MKVIVGGCDLEQTDELGVSMRMRPDFGVPQFEVNKLLSKKVVNHGVGSVLSIDMSSLVGEALR